MAGLIPEEVLEEIRNRLDIVDLISEYVVLKKSGRNYTGLCPFHGEKTPSFTVSGEKQMFYCFGCGAGGNVFTFIMRMENLDFPGAARMLADRLGIPVITAEEGKTGQKRKERDRLLQLVELAARYYHRVLLQEPSGTAARQYLENRGISRESIRNFQLGFSPPQPDSFYQIAVRRGFSPAELEKAGLAQKRYDGRFYDRFRGRLMFPIHDTRGKVVGFGGRVLDGTQPKYLNSPETELFQKGKLLYGLYQGRREIRDLDQVIIVEGYLDVIMSHQYGLANTVAPLGTALGKDQVRLLYRYTNRVTVAFDSDQAGIAATLRHTDLLHELGGQVTVATITEGKDPDEFLRKYGPDHYRETVLNRAVPLLEYRLEQAARRTDVKTIAGKVQVVNDLLPVLAATTNAVEREESIKYIATRLSLGEAAVHSEMAKYLGKMRKTGIYRDRNENLRDNSNRCLVGISPASGVPESGKGLVPARRALERPLLWLMLEDPEILLRVRDSIGVDFFQDQVLGRIAGKAVELAETGHSVNASMLADYLDAEAVCELTAIFIKDAGFRDRYWAEKDRMVEDFIAQIKRDQMEQERDRLTRELEESYRVGHLDRARVLSQEIHSLNKFLKKSQIN